MTRFTIEIVLNRGLKIRQIREADTWYDAYNHALEQFKPHEIKTLCLTRWDEKGQGHESRH